MIATGSLRADGSVLAYGAVRSEPSIDPRDDPSIASGVVDAIDGDPSAATGPISFVVRGTTYRASSGQSVVLWPHGDLYPTYSIDGELVAIPLLEVGDTVFIQYLTDDSGARVAELVNVRMSGEGTHVAGKVTQVWNDGSQFAVDGVPVVSDDSTNFWFRDPWDSAPEDEGGYGWYFGGMQEGQIVNVTGVLRAGVIFADTLVIAQEAGSRGAARLMRRPGRVHARGELTEVWPDGTIAVSGLAIRTRGRIARRVLKSASTSLTGRRVSVAATIVDGVIMASAIHRR